MTRRVAQAENRASQILEAPVSLNQDLTLTTALAPKDQIESLSGVTGSILESIPQLDHVYTLTVDGTTVGVNGDADVITQALNLVKEHYTTDETRSLYIESQVDIRYEYLPAGRRSPPPRRWPRPCWPPPPGPLTTPSRRGTPWNR